MLQRLDLVMKLDNPFDYDSFVSVCTESNKVPLSIGEYAQKLGMLKVALQLFPEDGPLDAYLRFVKIMSTEWKKTASAVNDIKTVDARTCGGCSGGQVR